MSIIVNKITNTLFQKPWFLYVGFLLLIIILKWSFIAMPPVWDEAFSIFPAADFLVTHGFDYTLLLAQPDYSEGGPTAHALSLLTLATALILKGTGGGKTAWIILHIMQWLMMAAIGAMLARIYVVLFDKVPALLLSIITLCYPLMLVQAGYMYIEVPLLFFTVLAFHHYRNDRIWFCSLFLVAACMIKESGVIAVGAMVLLALFENSGTVGRKAKKACILFFPATTVVLALLVFCGYKSDLSIAFAKPDTLGYVIQTFFVSNLSVYKDYISYIPELIVIAVESIFLSAFFVIRHALQQIKAKPEESDIIIFSSLLVLAFCLFHFIVYPLMQTSNSHFLSRYFFYLLPSMFLMIYYPIDRAFKKSAVKEILLVALILVCLFNRTGSLYPSIPFSSIAMAERSEEYINGYRVQKDYIAMIENKISKNVPVYVSLPDYFLTHYTVSGYVTKPLPNVHFIGNVLKNTGKLFRYPDHFVLVYSYPRSGGAIIQMMVEDLTRKDNFSIKMLGNFKKGDFSAYVVEIKKRRSMDVKGTN